MTARARTARIRLLELALGGVELRADRIGELLDVGPRRPALDLVAQVGGDRVLERLLELRVGLLERAFNLFEVLDVSLGDRLAGRGAIALLQRGEGVVDRAPDLADLGPRLRRCRARLRRGLGG